MVAPVIPGVCWILDKYQTLNVKCHINSAAPKQEIEQFLNVKELEKYFSLVFAADESKIKNLRSILALSEVTGPEAIFFGDSQSDLIAAKRAGISFVGIGSAMVSELASGNLVFAAQDFDVMLDEVS